MTSRLTPPPKLSSPHPSQLDHNTNATQTWLCAHLPAEPPEVTPSSISGPVLVTADDIKSEEYVDLTLEHWAKIMAMCKELCPNALFQKE